MNFNGVNFDTYFKSYPDNNGYFGKYGGAYVSPELKKAMEEIAESYFTICKSAKFINELRRIRKDFQGRPTPISHLERLSNKLGNVQIYVKREDLNHIAVSHFFADGNTNASIFTGCPLHIHDQLSVGI